MASRQFLLFILAGGVAAIANFGSRIILSLALPYTAAIAVAYCIGMAAAFALNRRFVFTHADNSLHSQATWFILVNILAVLQTLAISLLLARWLFPVIGMTFYPETVAHAFGVAVPVVTSYIGHRALTFRSRKA
ncbi:GtrA family protein [Luteimonas huabeiensis]|uniref:GtrA family protein n=1 Tax=Luteimonas huabeiensis TaxID=1244513 RepID=UPI000464B4CE|nr:GtrA family protein [Luteimonas huabeiensis]